MAWTHKDGRAYNTNTGAVNMRQHREYKRDQADNRNEITPVERTRRYRIDTAYRTEIINNRKKESAS
jgi:hypothetical protein